MLKRSILEKEYKFLLHLRTVRLNYRKFSCLEAGLFKNMNSLETINLAKNEINAINQDFIGLKKLKELQLSCNKINGCLTDQMFNGLLNLTTIDLSFNLINKLNDKTFNRLLNLKSIDLSHNLIENIEKPFENLVNLNSVDLSDNEIDRIDQDAFKGLVSLNVINLHDNKFQNNNNLVLNLEKSVQFVFLHRQNASAININDINFITNKNVSKLLILISMKIFNLLIYFFQEEFYSIKCNVNFNSIVKRTTIIKKFLNIKDHKPKPVPALKKVISFCKYVQNIYPFFI